MRGTASCWLRTPPRHVGRGRKKRPDLVLLDIWMPDTDGISLLKEWSAAGLLTMPVVMMSGHGTIDSAVEATRVGAVDFLEKADCVAKAARDRQEGAQARRFSAQAALDPRCVLAFAVTQGSQEAA